MNNLGERKVAGNFDLGKFLVFNYIQRNLLKTTFLEFLQNFSSILKNTARLPAQAFSLEIFLWDWLEYGEERDCSYVCETKWVFFLVIFSFFILLHMYLIAWELFFKNVKSLSWAVSEGISREEGAESWLLEFLQRAEKKRGRVRRRMVKIWL